MGDERRSKYVIKEIDQSSLELDKEVIELFLFVVIKLDTIKEAISSCYVN